MVESIIINNSYSLSPENGFYLQGIEGLGYKTNYSVNAILSRHGARLGNSVYQHKNISIALQVVGQDVPDLIAKRSALYKYLTVDNYSENDKIKFEFVLSNNQILELYGSIKEVDNPISVGNVTSSPLRISLETEFPFLTTKQLYEIEIPIALGGGAAVPMEIPLDFSVGAATYKTVAQGGNVFSYPIIRFNGSLTNPVLTDVVNGQTLAIADTITSGHFYEIDTFERTVIDDTGTNQLDKQSGEFLVIPASDENRFSLTTDNSLEEGYVTITFPYSYVSI